MTDIISTIIAQNPNIVEEIKAEEALTPYQKKQLLCYKYYRNSYATDPDFKKKQDERSRKSCKERYNNDKAFHQHIQDYQKEFYSKKQAQKLFNLWIDLY